MRLISPLLKRVVYPALSATGYLRPRPWPSQIAILTYHGVRPQDYAPQDAALDGHLVTADAFRAQLRLLKKHYHLISPEGFRRWLKKREALETPSILLTCDDGLRNVVTDLLPILLDEEAKCLFFLTGASALDYQTTLWYETLFLVLLKARAGRFEVCHDGTKVEGYLGSVEQRRGLWLGLVKQLSALNGEKRESLIDRVCTVLAPELRVNGDSQNSSYSRRFGLLTASGIRQLVSAGMTIGAHTLTHPILSLAPPELANAEISRSKSRLEAVLGTAVWAFAYPFGDPQSVNTKIVEMTHEAGFEAAFMNCGGGFGAELPQFSLPRLHITADMNLAEFEAHVSGFHRRLQTYAGRRSEHLSTPQA